MEIRAAGPADADWIRGKLLESWGSTRMVLRGIMVDATDCAALIAGDYEGLLHYRPLSGSTLEIVTLEAFRQFSGIGTALVEAVLGVAREGGFSQICVVNTNDNLNALRFYPARGFAISAVRIGAIAAARRLKPEIPPTGAFGLPIRDEIELLLPVT